jgi:hypothetical protein
MRVEQCLDAQPQRFVVLASLRQVRSTLVLRQFNRLRKDGHLLSGAVIHKSARIAWS